jgi:Fe-S-cluster containining protein
MALEEPVREAPQEEFLCVRCARHRPTCCQLSEVYVTLGDVKRIADHTGVAGFHQYLPPTNPVYESDDDDPTWRDYAFRPDGARRVLRRRSGGDCIFLSPSGCTLPLDVRPLLCRIYPYDFNDRGIVDELAPGCPLELLRPQQSLIEALDMNLADARAWHEQLYEEILWERDEAGRKNDLAVAAIGEQGV